MWLPNTCAKGGSCEFDADSNDGSTGGSISKKCNKCGMISYNVTTPISMTTTAVLGDGQEFVTVFGHKCDKYSKLY